MDRVVTKLKWLKSSLKDLHIDNFSKIMNGVNEAKEKQQDVQTKLHLDPLCNHLQEEEKIVAGLFKRVYLAKMALVRRCKASCLSLGDENNKYFHYVLNQRRLQQTNTQMRGEDMQLCIEPGEIVDILVNY